MKIAPNNNNGEKWGKGTGETVLSEINVVPLVDVILVLLIIFMITAPLLQQGLDIQLPQAEAPAIERSETDVILTINREGHIYLMEDNKNPYTLKSLEEKLVRAYRDREKKEIFVKADKKVEYGRVAATMAVLKKAGIDRIGMITEAPPLESKI